jgi:hypothetical protein
MLAVNTLVKWKNDEETSIERILWQERQSDLAFVIDVEADDFPFAVTISEMEEGISEGLAVVLHDDPYLRAVDEDKLSEKERQLRDKAWELIGGIVALEPHIYYRKERSKYIRAIAEKSGISIKTIGNYLKKYWRNGKTKNALLPSFYRCGARGKEKAVGSTKRGRPRRYADVVGEGINVDDDLKRIFRNAINRFYYSSAKHSLRLTYELMRKEYFAEGSKIENNIKVPILKPASEIPTFWQFRYWFEKERNIKKEISTRFSPRKYEQEYRPVLGSSSVEALGPGSIFQVDATLADVYLVSRYNRNWIIGRPVVYAIIDVFSRMVAGIYVGLEGPSWNGAMMAIANAAGDKAAFCKEYGIEITEQDWPARHIPEAILADRGELEGKNAENLINGLHVKIMNTPPYRCDWKGIIEQYFRTVNLQYKSVVPGTVDPDGRERGDRDYRLDAKLDIYQFTQIILKCVLCHNNQHYLKNYNREEMMIADDVECIPRELWNWGIENRAGRLRSMPEDIVKLNLMPSDTATVTPRGIRFKNLYYGSQLMLQERWTEKARMNGTWKLEICFDPRNMNNIYIKDTDGIDFEKCYLLDHQVRYKDRTFDEIHNLLAAERLKQKKSADGEAQAKVELVTEIQNIVQQAQKAAAAARDDGESDTKKKKSIRLNRQAEKLVNREKEAFELKKETPKGLVPVVKLDAKQQTLGEEENQLDLLRRKQKEALRKRDG